MTAKAFLLLALLLSGSGCVGLLTDWTRDLEAQQVPACIYTTRFLGPFLLQRAIVATGGATLTQCYELR